jgi:hypothetical protein
MEEEEQSMRMAVQWYESSLYCRRWPGSGGAVRAGFRSERAMGPV